MTEQGKDFFLLLFFTFFYQKGTLLIPFKIADRNKKTASLLLHSGRGKGRFAFQEGSRVRPAGKYFCRAGQDKATKHQQGCKIDTALVKAEADPKVSSYWNQAQDFSGALGERGPLLKSES